MRMEAEKIYELLRERFGEDVKELRKEYVTPSIEVSAEKIREILTFMKKDDRLLFDHLVFITGADERENLRVIYSLFSYVHKHYVLVEALLSRENPEIDTVSDVWITAEWHERETYDLVGIKFKEHPDMRRILLPEDWEGHPLRKDYSPPEFYHGIDNRYKPVRKEG